MAGIGRRRRSASRFLVVLVSAVLAACGPAGSPAAPAGSATPSPAAEATATPTGPALPDIGIRTVTYAEDRTSALIAVAELEPNDADVERLELYRDPAGLLRSIVAFHGAGGPSVLTFDAQSRLNAVESAGYRIDFAYTETEVEATITDPEGTVVTKRGPLQASPGGAVPAAPPDRAASARTPLARTALAEVQMAAYPMVVESWAVVPIEVRYTGKSRDPSFEHVKFENEQCVPGAGINCDARLMTMWHDGKSALVALVNTWVHTPDDPKAPGVIWRTREDCETFTPWWQSSLSTASWIQVTASIAAGAATLLGYTNPVVGLTIVVAAGVIKVLGFGTETFLPKDCWLAPNLLDLRKKALDLQAGATATLQVTAVDDCAPGRTTAWKVKAPKRPAITIQPLLPVNQSRFEQPGSGPELYYLPQMATLTVDAADCGREMTGEIDLKSLYPSAHSGPRSRSS